MEILQQQSGSKGMFYVGNEATPSAAITYSMTGKHLMIIDHTEVSDELRGKNVGYQMVQAAVEFARAHQIKIMPLCPFAHSVFKKKMDEFGDVLH